MRAPLPEQWLLLFLVSCGSGAWSQDPSLSSAVAVGDASAKGSVGVGGSPVATGTATPPASGKGGQGPLVILDAGGGVARSDAGAGSTAIVAIIRDFKFWNAGDTTTNADFENAVGDDHGNIVANVLGADQKPVYKNAAGSTATTHGKAFFDQWYNDVPGSNVHREVPIALTMSAQGTYGYDSLVSGVPLSARDPRKMWFPIDDGTAYVTIFGNQGQAHNYSFTTEIHTVFVYSGGEAFSFSGDDDVFVFINKQLVIDLGGVHAREQATVLLDALALVKGQQYSLDIFNAERHMQESNLSFTTTIHLQPAAQ